MGTRLGEVAVDVTPMKEAHKGYAVALNHNPNSVVADPNLVR
jgi:hypothetical protein